MLHEFRVNAGMSSIEQILGDSALGGIVSIPSPTYQLYEAPHEEPADPSLLAKVAQ